MSARRALLIGASVYGKGFASLPAVTSDVDLIDHALGSCGYDVTRVPESTTQSATELLNTIETFCARCQRDDVHIIFFSGHGMLLESEDCLIPAGSEYDRVLRRRDLRVPTDISASLPPEHGLVVFFIDACRAAGHEPTTKAANAWGDNNRIKAPADHRFVRFFGCSSGQLCYVLETGHEGRPVSVFSKAISEVLTDGRATTLKESLTQIQERCLDLATAAHLKEQTPRLSHGETSAAIDQILGLPIFEPDPTATMPALWEVFDPHKLSCLVIVSERETKKPPSWTLDDLLGAALADTGQSRGDHESGVNANPRIWDAFHQCWNGARLVSGATRTLPSVFESALVQQAILPINRALASAAALREAVRSVIEADLVVFDVTGFEPGVMMLMGVRAACRRGVTICSHGSPWREGQPIRLPFNLQDLSVTSHTPRETSIGGNPVVERFVDRVVTGFRQLSRQPRYVDLPAYDALRQLGSDIAASSLISTGARVLVLCPYEKNYFKNWELLLSRLSDALSRGHNIRPQIARVIDLASPQLVSQSIYEQARRTAACVVDWSGYSPSVFVEFGVRHAVSEWGAVSIIDPQFVVDSDEDWPSNERAQLEQVTQLRAIFAPIEYSPQTYKRDTLDAIGRALVDRHPQLGANTNLSIIHDAAWRAMGTVHGASQSVFAELTETANALSHADRGKTQAPQILFYESNALKSNSEEAALERRIAAWLYLWKREQAAALPDDDPRKVAYRDLGIAAAAELYERGRSQDFDLATHIYEEIKQFPEDLAQLQRQAALDRKRGDALRRAGREPEAIRAFEAGVVKLENGLGVLDRARWQEFPELIPRRVDTLGSIAGLLRRLERNKDAYRRYSEGAKIEHDFKLPTTYNRVNEIKYALLTKEATVAAVQDRTRETADRLLSILSSPATQQLGDDGWAWADLGDCRGISGELTEASRAYATFIAKAGVAAPATTLEILERIADALEEFGDPDRARVTNTMTTLRSEVSTVASGGSR
jgi:tetratricopeptide (TPR) repeat protein